MPKIINKSINIFASILLVFIILSCTWECKYFNSPPRLIVNSTFRDEHFIKEMKYLESPCITLSDSGRIWVCLMAESENKKNHLVVITSGDKGHTWDETLIIEPGGRSDTKIFDPQVWVDPDGQIWLFFNRIKGCDSTRTEIWAVTAATPNICDVTWSKPMRIAEGIMSGKPIVTSEGEGIITVSKSTLNGSEIKILISGNHGRSWAKRSIINSSKLQLKNGPTLIEKNDGTLWLLNHTHEGIEEYISKDKGYTWNFQSPTFSEHKISSFHIRRLNSGNLLLISNELDEANTDLGLVVSISKNDGKTWLDGVLIDEVSGILNIDAQQVKYGKFPCPCRDQIYVILSDGEGIRIIEFTEENIEMHKNGFDENNQSVSVKTDIELKFQNIKIFSRD